jgi:hypothetical protein
VYRKNVALEPIYSIRLRCHDGHPQTLQEKCERQPRDRCDLDKAVGLDHDIVGLAVDGRTRTKDGGVNGMVSGFVFKEESGDALGGGRWRLDVTEKLAVNFVADLTYWV